MSRFALSASLCLAALAIAAMPAAACERHQSHAVLAGDTAAPTPPPMPQQSAPAVEASTIVIAPAAAAAMSTAAGLGDDPEFMRCRHRERQVLTQ
jgi:hypothetical protein